MDHHFLLTDLYTDGEYINTDQWNKSLINECLCYFGVS